MDAIGWLMLGVGVMFLVLGLAAMAGLINGLPQREGRGAVAFGLGIVLSGIARLPDLPGAHWVQWAGALCMAAGLILEWRSGRRTKATLRRPPTHGAL